MSMRRGPHLSTGNRCAGAATLIAALLGLLPPGATAQEQAARGEPTVPEPTVVLVTAGEHGDFSRVVLTLGSAPDYRPEPEPSGLRILFPGARLHFDYRERELTSRARRVVATQANLTAAGSSFRLKFDCTCIARTSFFDGKLVIDVSDRERGAPHRLDAPGQAAAPPSGGLADGAEGVTPRPEFMRRVEGLTEPPAPTRHAPTPSASGFNAEQLRRMLARAVEDGHLTARGANVAVQARPDTPAGATAVTPDKRQVRDGRQHTAEHATDEPDGPESPQTCPEVGALDPATSFGTDSFRGALAKHQDLLGRALEAGEGVEQARLRLASFYLARLMPQETLAALSGLDREPADPATVAWLRAAALALADRPDEIAEEGRDSICGSADLAVWRATIAAARGEVPKAVLKAAGIAARVAAYPVPLRVELGLRLARASLDAGLPELAGQLLAIVEEESPEGAQLATLLFLKGRLAALRGDFAGARRAWQTAAQLPGEGGARAQLALLRTGLEQDAPAPPPAHALLSRLAFDWRGHPLQLEVAQLAARLHERSGRPVDALDALDQVTLGAPGRPKAGAAARLATDLLRRLYADRARSVPADQLGLFWRYEGFVPPGPEGADIRLGFARALLAHDLPRPAADLLEPLTSATSTALQLEAIERLAEARLILGQPELALDLLRTSIGQAPHPRPEWNLLAARALADLGRFAEAAGLLHDGAAAGSSPREQAEYLWRAGLWAEAVPAFAGLSRQAAGDGDEAAAERDAARAVAAAYMAGNPAGRLAGHPEVRAAATPERAALIARPPTANGPRARLSALLGQTDAVIAWVRLSREG